MKSKSLPFFLFCVSLFFLGASMITESPFFGGEPGEKGRPATRVWSLPEMDPIPQTDAWKPNQTPLSEEEQKAVQEIWLTIAGEVYLFVTPKLVQQLSRWDRERMKCYKTVTPTVPERIFWKPEKRDETEKRVLLSAPLESLPATQPMRRNLTLLALYNTETETMEWILVTIRSEIPTGWKKFF